MKSGIKLCKAGGYIDKKLRKIKKISKKQGVYGKFIYFCKKQKKWQNSDLVH